MKRVLGLAIASLLLIGVAVAAGWPGHSAQASGAHAVKKVTTTEANGQYAFSPKTITVKVGTKVVWTNKTDAPHTVTGTGAWKVNKNLSQGKSASVTFNKAGTYRYFCAIHPYMKAKVIVKM